MINDKCLMINIAFDKKFEAYKNPKRYLFLYN